MSKRRHGLNKRQLLNCEIHVESPVVLAATDSVTPQHIAQAVYKHGRDNHWSLPSGRAVNTLQKGQAPAYHTQWLVDNQNIEYNKSNV